MKLKRSYERSGRIFTLAEAVEAACDTLPYANAGALEDACDSLSRTRDMLGRLVSTLYDAGVLTDEQTLSLVYGIFEKAE